MAIIPIYGVTKISMTEKVQEKVRQVAGISGIEETHLTLDKGKWLGLKFIFGKVHFGGRTCSRPL